MDDFYRSPPGFPLLAKDALAIINSMITNILGDSRLSPDESSRLSAIIRSLVHDSFWGGIHINPRNDDASIRSCLAHVTDADLKSYWTHIGASKKIPMIRSLIHDIYSSVPYHANQLNSDIEAIKTILADKCQPLDLDLALKNIRAISEILILDGNNLSYAYCSDPEASSLQDTQAASSLSTELIKAAEPKEDKSPLIFQPKTRMISEKSYYGLATVVVIASGLIVWYVKRKQNP